MRACSKRRIKSFTGRCTGSTTNWSIANISRSSANRIKDLIQQCVLESYHLPVEYPLLRDNVSHHSAAVPSQTLTLTCQPCVCSCRGLAVEFRFRIGYQFGLSTHIQLLWFNLLTDPSEVPFSLEAFSTVSVCESCKQLWQSSLQVALLRLNQWSSSYELEYY